LMSPLNDLWVAEGLIYVCVLCLCLTTVVTHICYQKGKCVKNVCRLPKQKSLNKLILYLHKGINNKDARHGMASKSNDMDSIDASGSKWVQVA
jgi:hypothetical protein